MVEFTYGYNIPSAIYTLTCDFYSTTDRIVVGTSVFYFIFEIRELFKKSWKSLGISPKKVQKICRLRRQSGKNGEEVRGWQPAIRERKNTGGDRVDFATTSGVAD